MNIEKESIKRVTLNNEEVNQLWRLLKNECCGAESAEQTTRNMYLALRPHFEGRTE